MARRLQNDVHASKSFDTVPTVRSVAIRGVAFFEASKGAVVLLAASGLLSMIHKDVHAVAAAFIEHMHLNPASRYPQIFLNATLDLHDSRLMLLAAGAGAYAGIRFVEAYGLYAQKAWAEVLAAVSGGIYVPFELAGILRRPTWHGGAFLAVNLLVVALMVGALIQRRTRAAAFAERSRQLPLRQASIEREASNDTRPS